MLAIYSEQETIDLLAAAHNLGSTIPGLRGATYGTLFGLIASTGLRISEALHLQDTDVDLKFGMLTIRQAKFAKSRHVPLHPSTIEALQRYRALRNPHIEVADNTPDLILAFLDHLEQERQNSVRSRNLRLTALRAFLKFAARRDVSCFYVIEQALCVPMKRFERPILGFMTREEMLAVIGQPGNTWTSQRDHLLLAMLYNTGARVSEIIGVKVGDVVLGESACVRLRGKGRKQRSIHNSLTKRSISPHTIRHTTAMHLLQSGVAFSVIALWLGHESTITTHRYVEADLAMKEKALARLQEPETTIFRYHPTDDALMQFLQAL